MITNSGCLDVTYRLDCNHGGALSFSHVQIIYQKLFNFSTNWVAGGFQDGYDRSDQDKKKHQRLHR